MSREDCDDAVAAFIRTQGMTRCPITCGLPIQAIIAATDRTALADHSAKREKLHEQRMTPWKGFFRMPASAVEHGNRNPTMVRERPLDGPPAAAPREGWRDARLP